MKILYIGAGFVGTCSAAVMADSGHDVLLYDIDQTKINKLGSNDVSTIESCLFEEGLADMLIKNQERIKFTADYNQVKDELDVVDAIFMCLPTPEKTESSGESDLTYYNTAARQLAQSLAGRNGGLQSKYVLIINKSTVPIEMVDDTEKMMHDSKVVNFGVASNPEFLVEGKAIHDSLYPDRIVVGAWQAKDFEIVRSIYDKFIKVQNIKYIEVNPKEAAAGKLLANYYLMSKLANCFEVMGRTSESFENLNFENLKKIIGTDPRIGANDWGLYSSFFAGGSCFIKDTASLTYQLEKKGADVSYIKQSLLINNKQRDNFYQRAQAQAGFDYQNKSIAILGVAFKQNTNDIRNSGAIDIVYHLIDDGAKEIKIYDPAATPMFKNLFNPEKDSRYKIISYFNSEKEALSGTNVGMILTDWPQFREAGDIIKQICPPPYLIMDGRRILSAQFDELQNLGYDIIAVGSPFLKGKK